MTRAEVTTQVLEAKRRLGLTWKTIAAALGSGSPVFYTAALLELDKAAVKHLAEAPEERGATLKKPPSDPLIYRFYELVQGYGPTWKALINEEFGDGIMSAIDFNMSIEREPDPKGDRVKITMSGKFLPYKRF